MYTPLESMGLRRHNESIAQEHPNICIDTHIVEAPIPNQVPINNL